MGIKAENEKRVRELEEELSDEKMEGFFRVESEDAGNSVDFLRHERRLRPQEIIVAVVLAVGVVVSIAYLFTLA